jgi:hypothetical protein
MSMIDVKIVGFMNAAVGRTLINRVFVREGTDIFYNLMGQTKHMSMSGKPLVKRQQDRHRYRRRRAKERQQ